MLKSIFYYLAIVVAFSACQDASSMEEAAKTLSQNSPQERTTLVQVAISEERPFHLQVLANGKVNALLQSQLYFKAQGEIEKIHVANGDRVKAGQIMAVLDNRQQAVALEQAQNQYRKAVNDLNLEIVNYGGVDRDTNSVKPHILNVLKIKVGYYEALTAIKNAQVQYDNTFLIAPYSGIIANLKVRPHNPALLTEPFCTLLSRDNLVVEIAILESELAYVELGQSATIQLIAYRNKQSYKGRVFEINPLVSEQGLVRVKVKVENPNSDLLEGMNVNVVIEKTLPKYVIVPKTAVVERSGRKVVFTHEKGLAKWHYVTVAYENSSEVAISEGLKAGEQVIIDGNLNLGHDAPVEVMKKEQ
jgi:RND family efflux transporter MFP subunit